MLNNSRSNSFVCFNSLYYYNRRKTGETPAEKLERAFNTCLRYKDDSVRNYTLTLVLSHDMKEHPANYDDLFDKYLEVCSNESYKKQMIALNAPPSVGKLVPYNVLTCALKTTDGKQVMLKDVMHDGKPVYIDFWASWCGPCKQEIPLLMQLAEKYKDKTDFVYISVDNAEKEADWLKAIKAANFTGAHYLVQDTKLSDFAVIKSIPRYLIIDKNGKLNTFRGPNLLVDKQGFENTLQKVLSN
jgi:thiol-disulfide isomerase/thioredoxin